MDRSFHPLLLSFILSQHKHNGKTAAINSASLYERIHGGAGQPMSWPRADTSGRKLGEAPLLVEHVIGAHPRAACAEITAAFDTRAGRAPRFGCRRQLRHSPSATIRRVPDRALRSAREMETLGPAVSAAMALRSKSSRVDVSQTGTCSFPGVGGLPAHRALVVGRGPNRHSSSEIPAPSAPGNRRGHEETEIRSRNRRTRKRAGSSICAGGPAFSSSRGDFWKKKAFEDRRGSSRVGREREMSAADHGLSRMKATSATSSDLGVVVIGP